MRSINTADKAEKKAARCYEITYELHLASEMVHVQTAASDIIILDLLGKL